MANTESTRAAARAALTTYTDQPGHRGGDDRENISDLIADLAHLADVSPGNSGTEVLRTAQADYAEEVITYRDHLIARHDETAETVDVMIAETRAERNQYRAEDHNDEWYTELIHNRQHTSLDWDAGHSQDDLS